MRLRALTTTALALLAGLGSVGTAHAASLATYYVSATGSDSADGLSPATAWQTLGRAQQQTYAAGDQLLLQGGSVFPGSLFFDQRSVGTPSLPVRVGSFGTGRAVIAPASGSGITVYDTGGFDLANLVIRGGASSFSSGGGVNLYNDLPARQAHVHVSGVEVSGFQNGVEVGGYPLGFADVAVTDALLHDNRDAGMITYGPAFNAAAPNYANSAVAVLRVQAYRNSGNLANTTTNSGNGIVLGSVSGGSLVSSVAHDNGGNCHAPNGPVGLWTYDATGMRIAYNNSYSNRTGNKVDGDGFDLDQNVSNSVLEHNTSVGNDGAGYLVYTAATSGAHHDNVVRYNSSSGDSRKTAVYGGITVAGRVLRTAVYGNTVDSSASPVHAPALAIWSGVSGLTVTGNTLRSVAGSGVVVAPGLARTAANMTGNAFSTTRVQSVTWGRVFGSVAAWRSATGLS